MVLSFERNLEDDERKQALLRAVQQLPKEQGEVLSLKIWGELTFEEISRTLELSLNTVASRYRYALQKLKDSVPKELNDKTNSSFQMRDFEEIERELKSLSPKQPSKVFCRRIERAPAKPVQLQCVIYLQTRRVLINP